MKQIDLRLYAITERAYCRGRSFEELIRAAIDGGATAIQLREKGAPTRSLWEEAVRLRALTEALGVPFIVNDRVDVALASGADGVHLGQEDLPCLEARKLLGPEKIIGVSVHSLKEAEEALKEGADYLSVGKVYPSQTKSGGRVVGLPVLGKISQGVGLPVVAIGGIGLDNLSEVFETGASGVAIISGLFDTEDVKARAKAFREAIEKLVDSR